MAGGDPPPKMPPNLVPLVTSARGAYWQEGELMEASGHTGKILLTL